MKTKTTLYWVFLGLFSCLILGSVYNYVFHYETALATFENLGYPAHLLHPLIVAQILGIIILIANKGKFLIDWAYAGFFFNLMFAVIAHYMTAKGNGAGAVIGIILLSVTYALNKERKYEREAVEKMKNTSTMVTS